MRISHVAVRNYRCLAELDLNVEDYTVLIGANGTGKSSILYALQWFFDGGALGGADTHVPPAAAEAAEPDEDEEAEPQLFGAEAADEAPLIPTISVAVTFSELTDRDRSLLGEFGLSSEPVFTRSWDPTARHEVVSCAAKRGPGFSEVRNAGDATAIKVAYARLQEDRPDLKLPKASTRKDILPALTEWEQDPAHEALLTVDEAADATGWFVAHMEDCLRFVLIPAATDIASEIGATAKDSALNRLVGGLVSSAVAEARTDWLSKNSKVLTDLTDAISAGVSSAASEQASRVNSRLNTMLPTATVRIEPQMPSWQPRIDPTLTTKVELDGRQHDVSRQGHGVQRAVMIAMLQALVPDGEASAAPGEAPAPDAPAFVVAVEEPEIYQHPVRARYLARALWTLSQGAHKQVLLATHSPYFVRPEQFAGLRRLIIENGCSTMLSTTIEEVASRCGSTRVAVEKRLEKELPQTFSEGFFAEAAVLVEGDTDKVVLETIAERIGQPLDAAGIAVLAVGGKPSLRLAVELLETMGTRTYVMVDGDFLSAERRYPEASDDAAAAEKKARSNAEKRQSAHASHKAQSNAVVGWMANPTASGATPAPAFGDPSIATSRMFWLHDDLEHELEQWPAFLKELSERDSDLTRKDLAAYRAAASSADLAELPPIFKQAIEAMIARKES